MMGQNLGRMASCPPLLQRPGLPQTRSSSGEAQPGAGRSLVGSQLSDSNPPPRGSGRGALAAFFLPSLGFSSPRGRRDTGQLPGCPRSHQRRGRACLHKCSPAGLRTRLSHTCSLSHTHTHTHTHSLKDIPHIKFTH